MNLVFKIVVFGLITVTFQSCALFSAAGISSQGQPVKKIEKPLVSTTIESSVNLDHSQWDQLLKTHVNVEGLVNYKGFQKDKKKLDNYLKMLSSQKPNKQWSVQELLAFYINLYNAYTVNLILDNYPVKSIKDINGPWTKGIVPIGKNNLSLGGIENGVLRKMNEPRIHFAINCASISCPNLLNEAYTAAKINEQLDKAANLFINGDKNDITANNPKLSSIFDWYAKDYKVNGETNVIGYINQYLTKKIDKNASLKYLEYNWNLNEQQP
ncbi:MAG: DUF547 domain-containing protein [Flavobacteriaceae bacterium]|nr:DUF547 domain-containing protein [Flavobacteriaceae bacterium]